MREKVVFSQFQTFSFIVSYRKIDKLQNPDFLNLVFFRKKWQNVNFKNFQNFNDATLGDLLRVAEVYYAHPKHHEWLRIITEHEKSKFQN